MRVSNIQYVHFFINEKEYIFSVSSILSIEDNPTTTQVFLKIENDSSINTLRSFFSSVADEEILLFVGFYNKNTRDNDTLSCILNFTESYIVKSQLVLDFKKLEVK